MEKIVIVGGGTAGWMAAIALSSHMPEKQIVVIDPSRVAPIGVGESVTGVVLQFVRYPFHGLDTAEFFRECDATLKLGIWFKDWTGLGNEYLSPIDFPPDIFDQHYFEDMEDFYALITASGQSICEEQIHGRLMRANRTDYFRHAGAINRQFSTASCHFDALKFAAWLKGIARGRTNITHIDDSIERFDQHPETGLVTKILTEKGAEVDGDFFLDCTGFRRLLFERAHRPKWEDYSKYIKVDRAIPAFEPYEDTQEIPVFTGAQAMPNGWMWQIPTQSRLGRGYVFSSKYASDEQAISEYRAAGIAVDDSPRIIRFAPGKFETQWQGNVCALGLAGGFIEPLESTTIHIMHVQIKALAELFLPYYTHEASQALARKYNAMMKTMYDDFVDFVSFHYRTGRSDNEFWSDCQKQESITATNQARIDTWEHCYPGREDFLGIQTSRFGLTTGIVVWMPMLCGLGLLKQSAALTVVNRAKAIGAARSNLAKYTQIRDMVCANAVSQREAVAFLRGDVNG